MFEPHNRMTEGAIPMVRSGTVGALGVPLEAKDGGEFSAHLIDCRSYGGFSGSPVWAQFAYPGPAFEGARPSWMENWERRDEIGDLYHATLLWGMFIEHYEHGGSAKHLASNAGVGVVLSIKHVREVLMKPELLETRRATEREVVNVADAERKQAGSKRREPSGRDLDERIKIDMPFEDAVKAMLDTEPEAD